MKRKIIYLSLVLAATTAMLTACDGQESHYPSSRTASELTAGSLTSLRGQPSEMDDRNGVFTKWFEWYEMGHIALKAPMWWEIEPHSAQSIAFRTTDSEPLGFRRYGARVSVGSERTTRSINAHDWLDEFVNPEHPDMLRGVNILEYGVIEIDGVEVATVVAQELEPELGDTVLEEIDGGRGPVIHERPEIIGWNETSRRSRFVYFPHQGVPYHIMISYDSDNEDDAAVIEQMLASLTISDEPSPPRQAVPVELSGDPQGEIHALSEMEIWFPSHWNATARVIGEREYSLSLADRTYGFGFINPMTDRTVVNHTRVEVTVTQSDYWASDKELLEGYIWSFSRFPNMIEYGLEIFDGVEGARVVAFPLDSDETRIHEMIIIQHNGAVYNIQFYRSAAAEAELAIFEKIRGSIRFPVRQCALDD